MALPIATLAKPFFVTQSPTLLLGNNKNQEEVKRREEGREAREYDAKR